MKIETMANVPLSEYRALVEANQILEDMRKIMQSNGGNTLEQIAALLDFEKVEVFELKEEVKASGRKRKQDS